MTVAVLCIGTELTRGELVNTNATWLAEQLTQLGLTVGALHCTDDDPGRIESALRELTQKHEVLICTGGLGPTTDDLTRDSAAAALGLALEQDPASFEAIRQHLARFGRTVSASNARQACFPHGAEILPNPHGTAPGFALWFGQTLACFLPGVPSEMEAMFRASVVPRLAASPHDAQHQIVLRTYGMPESEVNDRLAGIEDEYRVGLGYRASLPELEVKVLARRGDLEQARQASQAAALEVRARLGPEIVFGEGRVGLGEAIGLLLVERKLRLALAESCTGGLVGELMTKHAGASRYFCGSAVTYENSAKSQLLGVSPSLLAEKGAVSAEVAEAMAQGSRRLFGADLALSLTGIAGPDGGTPEKPVGLVVFAVATSDGVTCRQRVFPGDRGQIRRRAAYAGLALLRRVLLQGRLQE